MKAKVYSLSVCESTLDHVHGFNIRINELYIPDLGLGVNDYCKAHIFETDSSRYTPEHTGAVYQGEIELPDNIVSLVSEYIKIKNQADKKIPSYFKTLVREGIIKKIK